MTTIGRLESVNVGTPRTVEWHGREITTAIFKSPVTGRRGVAGHNVDGDDQANRRDHGGPTKSLYAYAVEDYHWWAAELGEDLVPGTFGENLTTSGIDLAAARIGERWRIGSAVVRVTEPRIPCAKLGMRMGDAGFKDRFAEAARPGTYLGIDEAGEIGAGDEIVLVARPAASLTVGHVERARHGDDRHLEAMVASTELSTEWREWAERRLRR